MFHFIEISWYFNYNLISIGFDIIIYGQERKGKREVCDSHTLLVFMDMPRQ